MGRHHVLAFAFVSLFPAVALAGPFRLTTLDIGQGDAIVVVAPSGCAALFDGGSSSTSATTIKSYLASIGVTSLDFAVVSHYHADHIGGIDEVDAGTGAVSIGTVYDRGGSYTTATYDTYASHFQGKRSTVSVGQTLDLCNEVTMQVVAANANGTGSSDENARSVAVRVTWRNVDALIGGDLTGDAPDIESLVAPNVGALEIYKIHHHGSRTSSNQTFLDATVPTVALVSASWNNSYGHPHVETVNRLEAIGSQIWRTSIYGSGSLGHIEITSTDGTSFTVSQGPNSATYPVHGGPAPTPTPTPNPTPTPTPAPDTQPPSAPSSLVANAAATSVDLSWSASTDDTGVTGYRIERSTNGSSFSQIATSTTTSVTDGGLAPDTTYSYRVRANDAAGNLSSYSNTASATTPPQICSANVTSARWANKQKTLTVRATSSGAPAATLMLSVDGVSHGAMTWSASRGEYEKTVTLPAKPSCVTVTTDCGGSATDCL